MRQTKLEHPRQSSTIRKLEQLSGQDKNSNPLAARLLEMCTLPFAPCWLS